MNFRNSLKLTAKSLLAAGSVSDKSRNQDAFAYKHIPKHRINVMVLADGLGSFENAEIASSYCCKTMVELLESRYGGNRRDFYLLFECVTRKLKKSFGSKFNTKKKKVLGTTLLLCVETEDQFQIAYVGNGGIFHIRGNLVKFPTSYYLPWNSVNLLNPHTISEEGKEALYRLIYPGSSLREYQPTCLTIDKDKEGFGDILMLCTDGIFSSDQISVGKDKKGRLWLSGDLTLERYYLMLKEFANSQEFDAILLEKDLEQLLSNFQQEKLLSDDATLGMIITEQAQKNWIRTSDRDDN